MIKRLSTSILEKGYFVMINNLLQNVAKNFVLKKENIKKSLEYVTGYIVSPYRKLYYQSQDMKFDIPSVKQRSTELLDIMDKVDITMNEFFISQQEYEKLFKSQKIFDDISSYY
jgi:hypothetical protein